MEILFKDIPLDKVSTSMTINAPAAVLLAMYIVNAEKHGVKRTDLTGTIQNDVLKEYIARGTYIFPPAPSMKIITDIFTTFLKGSPKMEHDKYFRISYKRGRLPLPLRKSGSLSLTA